MIKNRTVAPADIMALVEAKEHLQVTDTDHDAVIRALLSAATSYVEEASGKALNSQTWEFKNRNLTGRMEFCFPVVPLISVSSITYFDTNNVSQSLTVGDFTIYSEEDRAWMVPDIGTNWPTMYARPDALTVTSVHGFSSVPGNLKAAVKLMLGHLFENRDASVVGASVATLPMGVEHLIGVSRVGWVG